MPEIGVKITRKENAQHFGCAVGDTVKVDFEEYVAAVAASELASGELEACKAQAVAARTFAMSRGVLDGKAISDSSSSAQAYRAPRADPERYPRCAQAARETAGQILTWDGKPARCVYSDSNGGRTVSSREAWGGSFPYLDSHEDWWDYAATHGEKRGHGVGMSQQGAKQMASEGGLGYRDILAFYYPGTKLMGDYGRGAMILDEKKARDGETSTGNERADAVVAYATAHLGDPYVYGAWGDPCTPALRKKYARMNPDHAEDIRSKCKALKGKGDCSTCSWNGAMAYDCRGFTWRSLQEGGISIQGGGATSQYNHSANWIERGEIAGMPDVVCCVFKRTGTGKMAHTGLHVGGGKVIHCSNGVQLGRTTDRGWTHYAVPAGLYTADELKEKKPVDILPVMRKGSRGAAVKRLQEGLNRLGFDCGSVDGIFGAKTLAAVTAFQRASGLKPDGIAGDLTNTALLARLALLDGGQADGFVV